MFVALGAAGATVAAVCAIVGIPVIDACAADQRGVVSCIREMVDRRFDLPGTPVPPADAAPLSVIEALPAHELLPLPPEQPLTAGPALPAVAEPTPLQFAATGRAAGGAGTGAAGSIAVDPRALYIPVAARAEAIAGASAGDRASAAIPEPWPGIIIASASGATTRPATARGAATPVIPIEVVADANAASGAIARGKGSAEPVIPPVLLRASATARGSAGPAARSWRAVPYSAPAPVHVAAAGPPPVDPFTAPATPLAALPPTLDSIGVDGDANYFGGDGPTGTVVRVYVDGEFAGESEVEDGRWLLHGTGLIDGSTRTLRIEAVDPASDKVMSSSDVDVEIDLPDGAAPTAPPSEPPSVPLEPAPAPQGEHPPLERLRPVTPAGETGSVTILPPVEATSITTMPGLEGGQSAYVTAFEAPVLPAMPRVRPSWLVARD